MILFSHPTGNSNVRHAALGLHRAGLLGEFWTSVSYRETPFLRSVVPGSLARQLKRRIFPRELAPIIRTAPWRELGRLLAPRVGFRSLVRHEKGPLSVDSVYHALDHRVSQRLSDDRFTSVYAYEDGAAESFRVAEKLGKQRLYDLPIGYWRAARQILLEEAERQPEWAMTLNGNLDSAAKTARKDEELQRASQIFVASSFTLQTLDQAPPFSGTVSMIPYGSPRLEGAPVDRDPCKRLGQIRVLFVGSLGQRKGLSYLFEAARLLGPSVELTIIGAKPMAACAALDRELARVRWIPSCSHREVLDEMAAHDVFVFPSLFEGFGLVLLEAMAMGLPIITTPHTAGPDLITDGVEGYIVPIRSGAAIAERLEQLRREPDRCVTMGEQARVRARDFTWEKYGRELAERVSPVAEPV
jgi:glycosyltransferase involved in cell wall biosynthesis